MNSLTIITIEVLIFIAGFIYIFKKEKIFGIYYLFLFVYAIFAQIGYIYFPELSKYIKAYFGETVWYEASKLIIFSFIGILIGFALFWKKLVNLAPFTFRVTKSRYGFIQNISTLFLFIIIAFQLIYLILNFGNINWYSNQDENYRSENLTFSIFMLLFKFSVGINIVLYGIVLDRVGSFPRWIHRLILIASVMIFFTSAVKLGNRTDLLAFSLGILTYHLYRDGFDPGKFLKIAFFTIILGLVMYVVETSRYNDERLEINFWAGMIAKDWYAPAHMLFAVIEYNLIDPIEVIFSNILNSLIMIGYPYLQQGIVESFNPGVATRSAGYAFYIFTEGYMMAGIFGFIYNSALVLVGLALWRKLALTNNENLNNIMLGLMGCMIVNLVRGQGSYFLKYLYTFIFPSIYLYAALSGQSLSLIIKSRLLKYS